MKESLQELAHTLKAARDNKGLSQRALGKLAGVPQGHVSKIEAGEVDLRVSSLIELARALDLEVMLVPRRALPAIESVLNLSRAPISDKESYRVLQELRALQTQVAEYRAKLEKVPPEDLQEIQRRLRDLRHFQYTGAELRSVLKARDALKRYMNDPHNLLALKTSRLTLESLRNQLAHGRQDQTQPEVGRPAYDLGDDLGEDA
jgi:transcriptional regulator with XRE-family HTH domain